MLKRRNLKITANMKGTIGNAMGTGDKGHCLGGSKDLASTTHGLGATVKFTALAETTPTAVKVAAIGTGGADFQEEDPEKDKGTVSQAGLAYAICSVRNLRIGSETTVIKATKVNLETDTNAAVILAALNRIPEGPSSKPLTTDEIKQLLTGTF
uniref:Variant surface glycoprotein n=1 Tax=Trypanosoma brucei TaxID=5691 RepID=A0A1V0FYP8_9TRYP|nr:variant surface glycoprotein [Trypanosoma brucei]